MPLCAGKLMDPSSASSERKPLSLLLSGRSTQNIKSTRHSYGTNQVLLSRDAVLSAELISGLLKRHVRPGSALGNSPQGIIPGNTSKPVISKSRNLISYSASPYGIIITITRVEDSSSATTARRTTTLSLAGAGRCTTPEG